MFSFVPRCQRLCRSQSTVVVCDTRQHSCHFGDAGNARIVETAFNAREFPQQLKWRQRKQSAGSTPQALLDAVPKQSITGDGIQCLLAFQSQGHLGFEPFPIRDRQLAHFCGETDPTSHARERTSGRSSSELCLTVTLFEFHGMGLRFAAIFLRRIVIVKMIITNITPAIMRIVAGSM